MAATALRRASALASIVALLAVAGCGDDEETTAETTPEATQTAAATETPAAGSGGGEALEITAVEDGGLSFDPAELTAAAGSVTVTMENPDGNTMPHAVEVEGNGIEEEGETVQAGGVSEVTVDLDAGEYVYYCPVGEHRENGMEGTLTVE